MNTGISNGIFEVPTNEIVVFAFIFVRYTITNLQTHQTLLYITRGAKWSVVKNVLFSSSNCEKWTSAET